MTLNCATHLKGSTRLHSVYALRGRADRGAEHFCLLTRWMGFGTSGLSAERQKGWLVSWANPTGQSRLREQMAED